MSNEQRSLCTFWLLDLCFGIEVLAVQEVIRDHDLTPVPLAPGVVSGLMNLRGQIITVIDLRRRMEMEDRAADVRPMHMVLHTDDGPVSLTVDRIGDVVEVSQEAFETPPGTVTGAARELIAGAYKLDGRLLLELETERVMNDLATTGAERRRA
jgi:purine-binding chemotaxis protein CheW